MNKSIHGAVLPGPRDSTCLVVAGSKMPRVSPFTTDSRGLFGSNLHYSLIVNLVDKCLEFNMIYIDCL